MSRIIKISRAALFCFALAGAAHASVGIAPQSATVFTGKQLQFSVLVAGLSNLAVTWSVSGAGCTGITCGSITSFGLYTAPSKPPNPPQVAVTATSLADPTQSATATLTIASPPVVAVSVSPGTATISVQGQQQFAAKVSGTSNTAVTWTVTGIGCVAGSCGTITAAGLYTAPTIIPTPAIATVVARSVADPSKSASASVVIQPASAVSVVVSPTKAQLKAGGQQQFSASVSGTTNLAVVWTVSGTSCTNSACGTINATGLYTAPAIANQMQVTVRATAVGAPTRSATATVTILSSITVSISPTSAQVALGAQFQFTGSALGTTLPLLWSISGSGCTGSACGTVSSTGLYTAPATAPNPNSVFVTVASSQDPTKTATATVLLGSVSGVTVVVSPPSIQLGLGAQQLFSASVFGNSNTAVSWSITGQGCSPTSCGTITQNGLYTAPAILPPATQLTVIATSAADPSKSGQAMVTIASNVGVAISPPTASVGTGGTKQFSATVTGTTYKAVSWTVKGASCQGSNCGTISSTGLYTAPSAVPAFHTVIVTATSIADPTKSASAQVSLVLAVTISVTPASALVTVNNIQQFQANVTGSLTPAVSWSVSGAGCSGAACGTITTGGLYTAPAAVPNPATVTVTAALLSDPTQSATSVVNITTSNNAKLKGHYAFLFKGFDANGVYQTAGSFVADGNGNITSGLEDISRSGTPATAVAFTGIYQVNADSRGIMKVVNQFGTSTFILALNTVGRLGRFVEFDGSGVHGSGVLKLQDPSAFSTTSLAGGYVFSLSGEDIASARIAALGAIFPTGTGLISGSSFDANDGGNIFSKVAPFSGSYSVGPTGRGLALLNISGFKAGQFHFAVYVISASEFILLSIDPLSQSNPIFGGFAEVQTGAPFLNSSFDGPTILYLTGSDGNARMSTIGQALFNGIQNLAIQFDQNVAGAITVAGKLGGTYSVQANGRGSLHLLNANTGTSETWTSYAIAPNRAFIMDNSSTVGLGELKKQVILAPYENSDLFGEFLIGASEMLGSTTPAVSGLASFDGGSATAGLGSVSGTEDEAVGTRLFPSQGISGTYSLSAMSNNGRGMIVLANPQADALALWLITPTEFVALGMSVTDVEPVVLSFEQ